MMPRFQFIVFILFALPAFAAKPRKAAEEPAVTSFMGKGAASNGPWTLETLPLPTGVKMEGSGLASLPDGRLAVATRNGDVWLFKMNGTAPTKFASGLHEPLGLSFHDGALYATQRTEITCLRDTNGDDVADEYSTFSTGWGVSGNYHEYAYGPVFDPKGTAWITLNVGIGNHWEEAMPKSEHALWRGWCLTVPEGGKLTPMACGLRSPCGIGTNIEGDVFASDQQGNWWPAGPLIHLRKGAFFGHAESLVDASRTDSPVKPIDKVQEEITIAHAIHEVPGYVPPAVWFPYVKMGQSCTGIVCDTSQGKFGPFAGQMLVGEFVLAGINRVFLEKVGGEYQGACFPFLTGFDCAVLQMAFLPDGSLGVGETNRGWNSLGTRSYGVQRVKWTGETPFEVLKMEALHEGFRFTFTEPVTPASAENSAGFSASSYTFLYHSKYGSPEVETQPLAFRSLKLSADGLTLVVECEGLREGYVHEFLLPGIRSIKGQPLLHPQACYTLNRRP